MALLSKKDSKLILDPLADNNPITIQVLGDLFSPCDHSPVEGIHRNVDLGSLRNGCWKRGDLIDQEHHSIEDQDHRSANSGCRAGNCCGPGIKKHMHTN